MWVIKSLVIVFPGFLEGQQRVARGVLTPEKPDGWRFDPEGTHFVHFAAQQSTTDIIYVSK